MEIKFRLNTTPTAQQRARHGTLKNGMHIAFKSAKQKSNERTLEALLTPYSVNSPIIGPVSVEVIAAMPLLKSDSKKTQEAKLSGFIKHTKKPDVDNLVKNLFDALTRMNFWHDDSQVVDLHCKKIYAEQGYWDVTIRELGNECA